MPLADPRPRRRLGLAPAALQWQNAKEPAGRTPWSALRRGPGAADRHRILQHFGQRAWDRQALVDQRDTFGDHVERGVGRLAMLEDRAGRLEGDAVGAAEQPVADVADLARVDRGPVPVKLQRQRGPAPPLIGQRITQGAGKAGAGDRAHAGLQREVWAQRDRALALEVVGQVAEVVRPLAVPVKPSNGHSVLNAGEPGPDEGGGRFREIADCSGGHGDRPSSRRARRRSPTG